MADDDFDDIPFEDPDDDTVIELHADGKSVQTTMAGLKGATEAMRRHTGPQTTLKVEVPHALRIKGGGHLVSSLRIGGDLSLEGDLNLRDELTVTVADADGTVIATEVLVCGAPHFDAIEHEGELLGIERKHTAKVRKD